MNYETVNCNLCHSDENKTYLTTPDYIFGVPGTFTLVECAKCGLVYLKNRPNSETLIKLYEQYYLPAGTKQESIVMKKLRQNQTVRKFYHAFTGEMTSHTLSIAKGRVLDIGCGSGGLLEDIRRQGCEVYGVELNPNEANVAKEKGINMYCGTVENANFANDYFDTIILNHVLEHLSSPVETLQAIYRILKPNGTLLIHSPNIKSYMRSIFGPYWSGWHLPFHFFHYSPESVAKLSAKAGFIVKHKSSVTPEYFFLSSLGAYTRDSHNKLLSLLIKHKITKSLPFRLAISCLFRILDTAMPDRGEGLRVELTKHAKDADGKI